MRRSIPLRYCKNVRTCATYVWTEPCTPNTVYSSVKPNTLYTHLYRYITVASARTFLLSLFYCNYSCTVTPCPS